MAEVSCPHCGEVVFVIAPKPKPRVENGCEVLMGQVAAAFHLTLEDLRRPNRDTAIVRARDEAMQAARRAGYSLPQIGRTVNRHHTTVLHSVTKESV